MATDRATCGCGSSWPGASRRAHCAACHATFAGVTGFDAHRRGGACRVPADVGLRLGDDGLTWRQPGSDLRFARTRDDARGTPSSRASSVG